MDLLTIEDELFASAFLSAFSPSYGQLEDSNNNSTSTLSNFVNETVTVSNEHHQHLDVAFAGFEPTPGDQSTFPSEEITQFLDLTPTNHHQQSRCAYEQSILGYPENGYDHQQAQCWTELSSCAYQQADNSVLTNNTAYQQDAFGSGQTYKSCRYNHSAPTPVTFHVQYPDSSITRKRKRVRTAFTTSQLLELEDMYRRNNYLDRPSRLRTAERMQLDEKVIKVWFQNRRMKEKRQECGEV